MPSMPCAKTSGMPARRATSMSMWIGLWSPEAPANSASVVRFTGGELQRRQLVADLHGVEGDGVHDGLQASGQLRQTRTARSSATSSPCWLVAREVLTTNSSAPFFLS